MLRRIGLAAILAAASALAPGCGSDPPLEVAQNVDLGRFQGKWYEIARLPRTTQTDCHGTTGFYSQNPDGTMTLVNQCNVGATDGPLKTVTMTAHVPNSSVPAKMSLEVGGYSGDYWILEVGSNYEYAVVGHPSREYLWILSRTPTLDSTTQQGIVERAQSDHFDTSKLEYTPQPPPEDRSSLDTPEGSVPPAPSQSCAISTRSPRGLPVSGLALAVAGLLLGARARRRR
jgi:apolipoprotein D and lipocalin family protein